jgi:hypothetical protein
MTGRCRATGKATSSSACTARPSGRSSSGPPASRCCCTCPARLGTVTSPGQERTGARRPRCRSCPRRDRNHNHHAARTAPPILDLRPRCGDGSTRAAAHRQRPGHLLLRPAPPPGSAPPTRTPTVCYANTSPKALTSPDTAATNSKPSQLHSTADPASPQLENTRRSPGRASTICSTQQRCDDSFNLRLAAVVGVHDRRGLGWLASPAGHVERVDHELGAQVISDRPAHHPPGPGHR